MSRNKLVLVGAGATVFFAVMWYLNIISEPFYAIITSILTLIVLMYNQIGNERNDIGDERGARIPNDTTKFKTEKPRGKLMTDEYLTDYLTKLSMDQRGDDDIEFTKNE